MITDGLSIPFLSFGRRIHSRTVSMTRTWTSRNAPMPDWLLGTRQMPADASRAFTVAESVLQPDVEAGTQKSSPKLALPTHYAEDADVPVRSQDELRGDVPHLGEASFLADPPMPAHGSLRRRATGGEGPGTPTTELPNQVSTPTI